MRTRPFRSFVGRGEWWRHPYDGGDSFFVTLRCPGCGDRFALSHDVHDGGMVSPAISCPRKECGYVGYVRLGSWSRETARGSMYRVPNKDEMREIRRAA